MTTNNTRLCQHLIGAGSIALVLVLAITYVSFIQGFLEYAFNMFYLANKTTNDYLTMMPRH